jgi:NTE family protein
MENKIGLALGGGGARGSYQIGILRALREAKLLDQIFHVSGTSIGAINTLMVMANFDYDRMVEVWEKVTNADIYGDGLDRLKTDRLGLFSLQDIYEQLSKEITLSEIRNSRVTGYATVAKIKKERMIEQIMLHRMEKEVLHLNNFIDPHRAVLASASIPVLFGSTKIGDDTYVDGGAKDNCPIKPLLDQKCNIILAVPIDGRFKAKKYEDLPICLIDFEPKLLFNKIPFDILDFKPVFVKDKAEYGYMMGKFMIQKLTDMNILTASNEWLVKAENQIISITKAEETEIKNQFKALMESKDGA